MSVRAASLLAVVLLAISVPLIPNGDAARLLLLYALSALAYSLGLKRLVMLDVIMLASFYTLRLLYGGAASSVVVSIWTLAFSMFLFLSLALVKRISELRRAPGEDSKAPGRGYLTADITQLSALSAASGCISSLVLVLYVRSPEVAVLYSRPYFLLGILPLLVYWQSRLLILANRGTMHEDPIVFSVFDRASHAVAFVVVILFLAAI